MYSTPLPIFRYFAVAKNVGLVLALSKQYATRRMS